jgi:hypothetical protein
MVGASIFLSRSSVADDPGRFATKDDVIGFWKMLPLKSPEKVNKVNPWPLPYQWFAFYEDGSLTSMASTEDKVLSRKELAEAFDIVKSSAPRYSWSNGFMVVTYLSPPSTEHWGVNIVTSNLELSIGKLQPGDLIMTLAGGSDGGPVYYRILRKVP